MIRYIELYPEADAAFNSGKIISVHVNEGDSIETGSLLFKIDAQGKQVDIFATATGKVQEMLVFEEDIIHKQHGLLILETIVDDLVDGSEQVSEDAISDDKSKETEKKYSKQVDTPKEKTRKDIMNEVKVPDLGGAESVEVIEILVNVGDSVAVDDPLITVESDKASMDIPATMAGTVEAINIKVGDSISEGDLIIQMTGDGSDSADSSSDDIEVVPTDASEQPTANENKEVAAQNTDSQDIQIIIPDLGGASDVDVIDLLVNIGDSVEKDQPIITVESDKASMDVPTSHAGVVSSINVSVGDKVNEGDVVLVITGEINEASSAKQSPSSSTNTDDTQKKGESKHSSIAKPAQQKEAKPTLEAIANDPVSAARASKSHASPSIRRLARELGVDLSSVAGSARKNRITKADVKAFAKAIITSGNTTQQVTVSSGSGIPEVPAQDFSKFGDIDIQPLNKIKRVTASHLHRSWLNIPHVTHNDESNIASLEEFRKTLNEENAKLGNSVKLSPLAFIVKAVIKALQAFPQFNSSLENGGENLILKNYFNIGIAVETPNGLVVPVLKNADTMNVSEVAIAMGGLAKKARDGKLTANDMQGGSFTISSLGGIGGTHFTPIVNAPEVAILGVSRTKIRPVWNGSVFEPAPILPLSLSYDHRVIDGAEAARFTRHVAASLEDIRRLTV